MKKRWLLGLLVALLIAAIGTQIAAAQPGSYTCEDGLEFTEAVNVLLMLTPGNFTITALGIDSFDPRIAITTLDGRTEVGCADDSAEAENYSADLPTTGEIAASPFNAQVSFSVPSSMDSAILAVYVDGFLDTQGQFLLLVEGGTLTASESLGDAFAVGVSSDVRASQTPVTAYMLGVDDNLDPKIQLMTPEGEPIFDGDTEVSCDDAGGSLCYGESVSLAGASITAASQRDADNFDAMLSIPIEALSDDMNTLFYSFTSFAGTTQGEYIAAFHVNNGTPVVTDGKGSFEPNITSADITWADNAVTFGTELNTGVVVTCPPNGTLGTVWGTDVYTNDSSICTAAVHAGLITTKNGGTFGLIVLAGQSSYTGSTRNGVSTLDYGSWETSYTLVPLD